jgi:hypothetical protein
MPSAAATPSRVTARSSREAGPLAAAVASRGFVLIDGPVMGALIGAGTIEGDAPGFADSWNELPPDKHMADGGHYRRRRHAVYHAEAGRVTRQADQPHYQSLAHNPLNGGVPRWFAPVRAAIGEGVLLRSAIRLLVSTADRVRGRSGRWRVEVHQFRIEADAAEAGLPTPEGMHRDGVDFVLVMLIGRRNAARGVSTIADAAGAPLVKVRLTEAFDTMILDDARVRHGVSPIEPLDPTRPAIRDALVVTVKAVQD